MLCCPAFPLVPALGSTASATGIPGFVRPFRSYYGGARLLLIVHRRLRLLTFPPRTIRFMTTYGRSGDLFCVVSVPFRGAHVLSFFTAPFPHTCHGRRPPHRLPHGTRRMVGGHGIMPRRPAQKSWLWKVARARHGIGGEESAGLRGKAMCGRIVGPHIRPCGSLCGGVGAGLERCVAFHAVMARELAAAYP